MKFEKFTKKLNESEYGVISLNEPIKDIDKAIKDFTKEKSTLPREEQFSYYNVGTPYFTTNSYDDYVIIAVYYDCNFGYCGLFEQGMLSIARDKVVNNLFSLFNYYGLNKHHAKDPYGCKAFNDFADKIYDCSTARYVVFDLKKLYKAINKVN